jgi:hypothetical protein
MSVDEARLRPHLRASEHHASRQAGAAASRHTGETALSARSWKVPTGDDLERLRGLPAIAPGVRGVTPGTDPLGALLAKERRRR